MRYRCKAAIWISTILVLTTGVVSAYDDVTRATKLEYPLLVLQNGHIIEGTITRVVTNLELDPEEAEIHPAARRVNATTRVTYSVQTKQGSRLVFQESDVDFVCRDKKEAYWQRVARIRATDIEGHKSLLSWCIKYSLFEQAHNQLEVLSLLPLKASELEYIHRQLVLAEKQTNPPGSSPVPSAPISRNQIAKSSLTKQPTVNESNFRPLPKLDSNLVENLDTLDGVGQFAVRRLPTPNELSAVGPSDDPTAHDSEVRQVGFESPIKSPVLPDKMVEPQLSAKELDEFADSIPKSAVAHFKRKIQPLIIRGCMAAGCHSRNADVMPLFGSKLAQQIPRRQSQRNLHSIMKFADANEPMSSPLLKAATNPHGGLDKPVLRLESEQFYNLANWLVMVSNKPNSFHEIPKPDVATRPTVAENLAQEGQAALADEPKFPAERPKSFAEKLDELANPTNATQPQNRRDANIFNRKFRK